jgi:uncharacterized peroxidase-related enzyme
MRVTELDTRKIAWYLKPFLWHQQKKYGTVLNPTLVWAQCPKLFMAVASLYGVIDRKKSPISPELRSLITVRVSQINWCRFCVDINSATLIKRSGSEEKCKELENWKESNLFSAQEKTALDYAEKMTHTNQTVDDSCFEKLKQFFSEKAIIELTALIAFQNMSSKFNSALDIAPQGFCNIKK